MTIKSGDPLYSFFYYAFISCAVLHYVFTCPKWKHLVTFIRSWLARGTPLEMSGADIPGKIKHTPHVTISICAYNEGAIVPETIDGACRQEWPMDKLTVHVCDDSTDKRSIQHIKDSVAIWRKRGFDVERLTRPDRVGYKAGNLRYNFGRIKGEYVAYFDADHRPEPDFLQNTMPYFFDQEGNRKRQIGLVQTPWAFYNTHQNILTESDSFCLDTWYIYEYGRSISNKLFGFWGTGGVWQKQAVEDGGGFTWESVTEDILISYKAYMAKRYEFVYLPHYPQLLEVPSDILAHIQQKHRWTKGYLQVFRFYCWMIVSSREVPFRVKYEFVVHVLGALHFILAAFCFVMIIHLRIPEIVNSKLFLYNSIVTTLESILSPTVAVLCKTPASNGHYKTLLSRIMRLRFWIAYTTLQLGMTPFEIHAILDGLLSNDATFWVTPKKGSPTKARRHRSDDVTAFAGLFLAFHQAVFLCLNAPFEYFEVVWMKWLFLIGNAQFMIGLVLVSSSFLRAKHDLEWRMFTRCLSPSSCCFPWKIRVWRKHV